MQLKVVALCLLGIAGATPVFGQDLRDTFLDVAKRELGSARRSPHAGTTSGVKAGSSVVGFVAKRLSLSPASACTRQGPFAPRAFPRFFARMGPADSRRCRGALMSSCTRWVPPTSTGLPDHWLTLSVRAVPNHPGRPGDCTCPLLRHRYKASSTWGAWPPATWRFEAESGSLALRLAPSLCGVPSRGIAPADRSASYVSNGPLHGCLLSCSKVGQVHWRFPRRQSA